MPAYSSIIVVSGLPRSGTSMMMRMIQAAGVPALTDHVRGADADNPNGYLEYEPVKRTAQDPSWVPLARGKVVKMVHLLLRDLPASERYSVVLMHRDLDEVLASQRKMLDRAGKSGAALPPETLRKVFASQMQDITRWLAAQPNFRVLEMHYNRVLADPAPESARLAAFLDLPDRAAAMAAAIEPSLYCNRKT